MSLRNAWNFHKEEHDSLLMHVYRLKRTPATHVMIVSISHEERRKKPYAIPVLYFPYTGISDAKFREKVGLVREEMIKLGLKPVGELLNKALLVRLLHFPSYTLKGFLKNK